MVTGRFDSRFYYENSSYLLARGAALLRERE